MEETKNIAALVTVNDVLDSVSFEESQNAYGKWSNTYDIDLESLGSETHLKAASVALNYLKEDSTILDIGAGTGRVAEILRKHQFNGVIDALDANLEMLLVGEKKKLHYRNIIRHSVVEDGILPLKDRTYDVVISSGSFLPGHIPATALKGIINVVKKNGMFLVTIRHTTTEVYKAQFDRILKELEENGKIIFLETKEFEHYSKTEKKLVSIIHVMKVL